MTVQGGGGGRKIPGGPPLPATPRADKPASTPPTAATKSTPPSATASTTTTKDGFDSDPRHASERAALPFAEPAAPGTTSGIDSMIGVLESSREQILDEHRAVREKLRKVVSELAKAGFERAILDDKRAEIVALRTRLGALRRRLQHIQRRLKAALGKARLADADVTKALAGQLERLARLEPGVERAFVALSAFEQAAGVDPFSGGVIKNKQLPLDDEHGAETTGSRLARATPGASIAVGIAHLLGAPPMASMEGAPLESPSTLPTLPALALIKSDDDAVANLQGLADLLLVSLR